MVNISFIGCPCSGKTTIAAMLFAEFKEIGWSCEFVPEQARMYIAKKRVKKNLSPEQNLILTNDDQKEIMSKQIHSLDIMRKSVGSSIIIITDSSPFNSLLYMDSDYIESSPVQDLIKKSFNDIDLIFYTPPVDYKLGILDPNRVHSIEQSLEINQKIPIILKNYFNPNKKIYTLNGDPKSRLAKVASIVNEVIFK